jgi:hypothetical protein
MSEEKKTQYCGSGRKQSENWIKATINIDKVQDFIEEFKGVRFVRLNINIKDDLNQFGKDVSLSIDQFVPDQDHSSSGSGSSGKRYGLNGEIAQSMIDDGIASDQEYDDLPF